MLLDLLNRGRRRVIAIAASKLGFDSGYQLERVKGLGNIVVCPQGETHNFIHVLNLSGEHYNRKQVLFTNFLTERKAAHVRQHNVQNGKADSAAFNTV